MISYEYITEYIRKTIKPNTGLISELESFARENHVPIIQPEVAKLLLVVGKLKNPFRILEAGTAIGYSSILMASFLKQDGRIDTVERYDKMVSLATENINRAGLEKTVNIISGDVVDVFKCLNNKYDMIFLDAAKGQYIEILPECLRLLDNGGLLISDNVLYKGMIANDDLVVRRKKTIVKRMRAYLDAICNHPDLDTSILSVGDGVALSYKR